MRRAAAAVEPPLNQRKGPEEQFGNRHKKCFPKLLEPSNWAPEPFGFPNFKNFFNFAMHIRFVQDGSDFRSYGGGSFSKDHRGNGGLFWWTIGIFLLLALATVSWFFSIMVFTYPEKPFNYDLLTKLNKLDPIKKYTASTVPRGQIATPTKLLEDYALFTADRLRVTNDGLKRDYIRNFKEHGPLYIRGSFTVLNTRKLESSDVFSNGWIVSARALDMEDVTIELVLPGLATKEAPYAAGEKLTLDNKSMYASAVHLQKHDGDRMTVTLVPLLYDAVTTADGSIAKMEAPQKLNMAAVWPIWRDVKAADVTDAPVVKAVQVTAAEVAK